VPASPLHRLRERAGLRHGILALAAAGCKVICDDVSYFDEPFFQNGVVAQAIKTVEAEASPTSRRRATTPVTATRPLTRYGSFDGTILTDTESFGGNVVQTVTINTEGTGDKVPLILQWNQPYGAATSDLEVVVFRNGSFYEEFTNQSTARNCTIRWSMCSFPREPIRLPSRICPAESRLIKEITAADGFPPRSAARIRVPS